MSKQMIVTPWLAGMCLLVASSAGAQPATTQPANSQLPEPDPIIQPLLKDFVDARDTKTAIAEWTAILEASSTSRPNPKVWPPQLLLCLLPIRGEQELVAVLKVTMIANALNLDPVDVLMSLAPYLDASDARQASLASGPIGLLGKWEPRGPFDNMGAGESNTFIGYLNQCAPADPSWKVVRIAYSHNAEAALNSALRSYLNRDWQTMQRIDRARKELLVLILSYDLASADQKPQLSKSISAKLDEFAQSPHWFVRGYPLAVISRALQIPRGTRARTRETDTTWTQQSKFIDDLCQDPNPFVSTLANELKKRLGA